MIYALIYSLMAICCAYLARYKSCKYGLEIAFFILAIFMGLRYDWGNDYPAYLSMFYNNTFNNILSWEYLNLILIDENSEFGWKIINMLFKPFGFFTMVFVLTCFEYYVLYKLIKKYVAPRWYWFSIFIFTFNSGFMLTGCSMMRQYLAMTLVLLAINYIIEAKPIKYITCILLCSTIHTSSLLMLPFYWIRLVPQFISNKSLIGIVFASFCYYKIASLLFVSMISYFLSTSFFVRYETYSGGQSANSGFGLGVLYYFCVFILSLKSGKYLSRRDYILVLFSSLYILIIPFTELFPLAGRLGYYYTYFTVISLPILMEKIPSKIVSKILLLTTIIFVYKLWHSFFHSEVWRDSMMEYKSILSAPYWM